MPYIDLDAAVNGSGTEASPYNSFTELNALTGTQSGDVWRVKRGTTTTDTISNILASNYRLDVYGSGDKPIIDGTGVNDCIKIAGNDIAIYHLDLRNANNNGLYVTSDATCNNLRIVGNNIQDISGAGNPEDGMDIKPLSSSTGVVIRGNTISGCDGNAIEFGLLDGAVMSRNIISDVTQAFEAWTAAVNCVIERNTISDINGRAWWIANEDGAGSHVYTDNIFRNNTVNGCATGVDVDLATVTTTGNQCYNNTFVVNGWGRVLWLQSGTAHTFKNNVVYFSPTGSTGVGNGVQLVTGVEVTSDIDHNYYYLQEQALTDSGGVGRIDRYNLPKFHDGSSAYQSGNSSGSNSLVSWATATGFDTHSWGGTAGGDPFTDLDNGDITLLTGSEVLHDASKTTISTLAPAVESGVTTEDRDQNSRYGDNDPGGLQYQRHPTITTGIKL